MDRITQSLFDAFIKTFDLSKLEPSEAFERFVAYCVLTKELSDNFETDDVSTGHALGFSEEA